MTEPESVDLTQRLSSELHGKLLVLADHLEHGKIRQAINTLT